MFAATHSRALNVVASWSNLCKIEPVSDLSGLLVRLVQLCFIVMSSGSYATSDSFLSSIVKKMLSWHNVSCTSIRVKSPSVGFYLFMRTDYEVVDVNRLDCSTACALPPSTSHPRFKAVSDDTSCSLGRNYHLDRDAHHKRELRRKTCAQLQASAGTDEDGTSSTSARDNGMMR